MKITESDLIEILVDASSRLHAEIRRTHKTGTLENYLGQIGMLDLLPTEYDQSLYKSSADGKIVIFGDSQLKEREILGALKGFGLTKERLELHLDYEDAKTYRFKNMQYNPNYRLLLFGPVPHSGISMGKASSIISEIEQTDGYPKVIRLEGGHGLKITKSNLMQAIEEQISEGYLVV